MVVKTIIPVYWAEINAHEVYLENMERQNKYFYWR